MSPGIVFFFHLAQVVPFSCGIFIKEKLRIHEHNICYVNLMRIKSDSVNLGVKIFTCLEFLSNVRFFLSPECSISRRRAVQ